MSAAPDISVVMGVYNGERHLRRAVDSMLAQQDASFEFIVVDDGSDDATPDILADYVRRDPRLVVQRQDHAGLTRALIRGCAAARGRFIARQDADDASRAGRLARLLDFLRRQADVGFASSWVNWMGPDDEALEEARGPADPHNATAMIEQGIGLPVHGSIMMRREAYEQVGGYRAPFYYAQDLDLFRRLVQRSYQLGIVQETLYDTRRSPYSISALRRDVQREFARLAIEADRARRDGRDDRDVVQKAAQLADAARAAKGNAPGDARRSAAVHYMMASSLERTNPRRAVHHFWMSARLNPLNPRAWVRLLACLPRAAASRPRGTGQ